MMHLSDQNNRMPFVAYVDNAGRIWRVDAETGVVSAAIIEVDEYFASNDCTGESFLKPPSPRMTQQMGNSNNRILVRPDDLVATERPLSSWRNGGTCFGPGAVTLFPMRVLPQTALQSIDAIQLSFTGPLHQGLLMPFE
jgi:hypothetical protein